MLAEYNNIRSMSDSYIFWLDNPNVLYEDGTYTKIVPTYGMTRVEQLNTMTRFFIYIMIIFLLLGVLNGWILLPIVGVVFIVVLYYIYTCDPNGKQKETFKRQAVDENFEQNNNILDLKDRVNYEIQSGYYDSDGKLQIGKEYSIHGNNVDHLVYTPDELLDYHKATCRRPTKDNPFMNPTIMDFNTSDPPIACNSDDEDIKSEITNNFNRELYMDLDDLFDVKNSQRMWYTVPMPAVPPDRIALAKWLFRSEITCKQDQEMCLQNIDLRYER
jgi:hypothetical protein